MSLPKSIQVILDDNVSGSVTLLKRLMVVLEKELLDPELDPTSFIGYIQHIRKIMEMFTVIRHFCDELILSHNVSTKNYPVNYLDFISEYKEFWEKTPQLLLNNLQKKINLNKRTVLFHSNSGTIREVFRLMAAKETTTKIIQTLSAPMEEGRVQAHDLATMGYQVTLIPDALAAEKIKNAHYVILGADQVRKNSIINKVGSLQIILSAQHFNVPVYILTESRKMLLSQGDGDFKDKNREEQEILHDIIHPNLKAENYYFEEIPKYLLTGIITERTESDN